MGHYTYRKPTLQEIAEALRYMECEFVLATGDDGCIHLDGVHWTEGLAYGPARVGYPALLAHVEQAREVISQLTDDQWVGLASAADYERVGQQMPALYQTGYVSYGR